LFGVGIAKDAPEIGDDGTWPDGNRARELLEPDLTPVLAEWSGEKFQMANYFQPLVEIEF
jgi:hypothetical protein